MNGGQYMKKRIMMVFGICMIVLFGIHTRSCSQCKTIEVKASTVLQPISEIEYPQTIIHEIVLNFLNQSNEVEKKVLIMGYDGFRRDGLNQLQEESQSGIIQVMSEGGLYLSYAGGETNNPQDTSTAPGWSSILTGEWSDVTKVEDNEDVKATDAETLLTTAARMGYSARFVASWSPHFDTTYHDDIVQTQKEQLDVQYLQEEDDAGTRGAILSMLQEQNDADVMFFTLEESDHAGHSYGYGNDEPAYVEAIHTVDTWGAEIINAIKQRATYENEDWLILITSDHGGVNTGHGGQSEAERSTWFACNRKLDAILE